MNLLPVEFSFKGVSRALPNILIEFFEKKITAYSPKCFLIEIDRVPNTSFPTNTPRGFHVETTMWNPSGAFVVVLS